MSSITTSSIDTGILENICSNSPPLLQACPNPTLLCYHPRFQGHIAITHPGVLILPWGTVVCILILQDRLGREPTKEQAIRWMLQHGCSFSWFVYSDAYQPTTPLPSPEVIVQTIPSLFLQDYRRSCREIMRRPHAKSLFWKGALAWRLAVEFSGSDCMSAALKSPSSSSCTSVVFNLGESLDPFQPLATDSLTQSELDVILGNKEGRTIWPTFQQWEASLVWTGEWDDVAEYMFMRILCNIERKGETSRRSSRQWTRMLWRIIPSSHRRTPTNVELRTHFAEFISNSCDIPLPGLEVSLRPGINDLGKLFGFSAIG